MLRYLLVVKIINTQNESCKTGMRLGQRELRLIPTSTLRQEICN